MIVSELIEWLKGQDQGAIVEVVEHKSGHTHYDQGGNASTVDFDPTQHIDYTDWRTNQFVKSDAPHYQTRTLLLGVMNG